MVNDLLWGPVWTWERKRAGMGESSKEEGNEGLRWKDRIHRLQRVMGGGGSWERRRRRFRHLPTIPFPYFTNNCSTPTPNSAMELAA